MIFIRFAALPVNLPLRPSQHFRSDADGAAILAACDRVTKSGVTCQYGETGQFLRDVDILGDLLAISFQQANQMLEIVSTGKSLAAMDENGLDGLLRRLLRVKTQVCQINICLDSPSLSLGCSCADGSIREDPSAATV